MTTLLFKYAKANGAVPILLCLILFVTAFPGAKAQAQGELSGYVAVEASVFTRAPLYAGQKQHALSFSARPEYYKEWNNGNSSFTFAPFLRVDSADDERSHFDVRELFLLSVYDTFELGVGIKKVFWGVAESQHLVDIINQTDSVESVDGEEKLGQPMVSLFIPLDSLSATDLGTIDIFVMPYFRERTFAGKNGRLRSATPIDTDRASYESDTKERNIDLALRWNYSYGEYDLALSYFRGTGRTPVFTAGKDPDGNTVLLPRYVQVETAGLEAQKVHGDWLLKLEAIAGSGPGGAYGAWTGGFEYSMTSVLGTVADIGLLGEWSHDTRGNGGGFILEDDLMFGLRIAVNDLGSTEALLGIVQDIDTSARSLFLESSRRYGDHLRVTAEAYLFADIPEGDSLFGLRHDSYVKIEAAYWF